MKPNKLLKRFNWKSRLVVETKIDETEQKKIKVDFDDEFGQYDACNALVLPSTKRKTRVIKDKNAAPVKLLSKKQRQKLMKITEKKQKMAKREALLKELKEVQATPELTDMLTSVSGMQTLGRRKALMLPIKVPGLSSDKNSPEGEVSKSGWKGKKRKTTDETAVEAKKPKLSDNEDNIQDEEPKKKKKKIKKKECKNKNKEKVKDKTKNKKKKKDKSAKLQQNDETNEELSENNNESLNQVINNSSTEDNVKQIKSVKPRTVVNSIYKTVSRDPEIQKHRLKLPILSEEHIVMEAINENPITIIIGPTGSGKTTQVPQFLYEAGFTTKGMIGVTEPRRIAATSMAERVGLELNLPSSKVSYQIRYEGNTTKETEIKFMTDGVLFQEIKENHFLTNYSAIIIDEVHERSIHSDILLGFLSRIVPKRAEQGNPLKLIIMSATPRIEDFTENSKLFKEGIPPVIKIPSRLFSVTVHFNRVTDSDYCLSAYKKVCCIHRKLPDGGILVFLSGQQEINELCRKLKQTFPLQGKKYDAKDDMSSFEKRLKEKKEKRQQHKNNRQILPEVDLKNFMTSNKSSTNNDASKSETNELKYGNDELEEDDDLSTSFLAGKEQPLWVLPLYSLLPSHKQRLVFDQPPEGTRLCVIATNVAETSLTIPNIKYVVDSGKTKEKFYDPVTGVSSYHVTWTSKASATQRSGRSGRTSDGYCYRLYSSAVYNDEFSQYAVPDIQKRPLDDVVLGMKALKIPVYTFPYPSPPDYNHLSESFKRLIVLGALEECSKLFKKKRDNPHKKIDATVITEEGVSMSRFPMAPRFAKIVLNCYQQPEIFPYVVMLIAALTVREIFIEIPLEKKGLQGIHQNWASKRLKWAGKGRTQLLGDLVVLINAVLEAEQNDFSYEWCYENGLRHSALLEYRKLRRQITNEINVVIHDADLPIVPNLNSPTEHQAYLIAEVMFMGSLDQVARKVQYMELKDMEDKSLWKNAYRTVYSKNPVFISSASVLHKDQPKYIMYQEIYKSTKTYLRGITVINEAWLLYHGGTLADLSPPLDLPAPVYDLKKDMVLCHRKGTFGPDKWELNPCQIEYPLSTDLFRWVAYFFLIGELWTDLKTYVKYLYDPKTLLSPITLKFREKRENLIKAFASKAITSGKSLGEVWKTEPNFLKREYFAWFENEEKLQALNSIWPLLKEEKYMYI